MNSILHNLASLWGQFISSIKLVPQIRLSVLRKVFSLMGRREKTALIIMASLAILSGLYSAGRIYAAYTVPAPAEGGSYREGIIGQPRFINPLLAASEADQSIVKLVFSGL